MREIVLAIIAAGVLLGLSFVGCFIIYSFWDDCYDKPGEATFGTIAAWAMLSYVIWRFFL